MKENGFDSAIGEYALDPKFESNGEPATSSQLTKEVDESNIVESIAQDEPPGDLVADQRSSSPFFPQSEPSGMDANDTGQIDDAAPESSAPVSLQLTVDYPNLSHVDLGSDLPTGSQSRNSSSHQNAQRLSPLPPDESTILGSGQRPPLEPISDNSRKATQTETNPGVDDLDMEDHGAIMGSDDAESSNEEDVPVPKKSLLDRLGLSVDGAGDSSYHESDDENDSESSEDVPSFRELTSSQKRKIMTRATSDTKSNKPTSRISPLPVRRRALRGPRMSSELDDELELLTIKTSSSQAPRLSQIPKGSQVVDLTLSSDPASPGNSDGEFELRASRRRRRAGSAEGGEPGRTTRRSATTSGPAVTNGGIGQRRLLTTKKSRSFV
jgi:hypothetical protein